MSDVEIPVEVIYSILENILIFVWDNRLVFSFVFIPIATTAICIVIDFIFDVRDNFTDFHGFNKDTYRLIVNYRNKKNKKQKELDMNDVYKRSKENADYKHKLKMEEMQYFRENENIRHEHKHEENEMYKNRYSAPKHSDKKKVNLDIDYDGD